MLNPGYFLDQGFSLFNVTFQVNIDRFKRLTAFTASIGFVSSFFEMHDRLKIRWAQSTLK